MAKKNTPIPPSASSLRQLAETKGQELIQKSTIFRVDPYLVEFEKGFNLRTDDETLSAHIERLYLAMKEGASIPPIDARVEEGRVLCVDGHCRTVAARHVKKEIPDFTLEVRQFRGNDQERIIHMLGTGSGQKTLTPLEQGQGFLRLIKFGLTSAQIAAKLGISRVTVDNNLMLAEAPTEVQDLIKDGKVSSTQAREVIKQGPEAIEALKEAAASTEPEAPTKNGKASTKKKVTAKKLTGTAAEKKKAKKKKTKGAKLADDEIQITIKKFGAQAILDKCKDGIAVDEDALTEVLGILEMALM